jgi:hypothetical protein
MIHVPTSKKSIRDIVVPNANRADCSQNDWKSVRVLLPAFFTTELKASWTVANKFSMTTAFLLRDKRQGILYRKKCGKKSTTVVGAIFVGFVYQFDRIMCDHQHKAGTELTYPCAFCHNIACRWTCRNHRTNSNCGPRIAHTKQY